MHLPALADFLLTVFVLSSYSQAQHTSHFSTIHNRDFGLSSRANGGSYLVRQPTLQSLIKEIPGPFSPRYQIGKYEMSDEEWADEIKEGFSRAGLVPGILPHFPSGLVNINYGPHACVHMGSFLKADTTAFMPSRVSYPSDPKKLYTLILLDLTEHLLLWMFINIPGTSIINGQEVAKYQPPAPHKTHMYLSAALLQPSVINRSDPNIIKRSAGLCQLQPRTGFHVKDLMEELDLETIVAANFFTVEYEMYVNSIDSYCAKSYG